MAANKNPAESPKGKMRRRRAKRKKRAKSPLFRSFPLFSAG